MCNDKTLVELDAVLGILEDEMPGHYLSKKTQIVTKLRAKDNRDREDDDRQQLMRLMTSFERIADVLELWADMQGLDK